MKRNKLRLILQSNLICRENLIKTAIFKKIKSKLQKLSRKNSPERAESGASKNSRSSFAAMEGKTKFMELLYFDIVGKSSQWTLGVYISRKVYDMSRVDMRLSLPRMYKWSPFVCSWQHMRRFGHGTPCPSLMIWEG